jgi:hypothetical protein
MANVAPPVMNFPPVMETFSRTQSALGTGSRDLRIEYTASAAPVEDVSKEIPYVIFLCPYRRSF